MDASLEKTGYGTSKLSKTREEPDYTSYDAPPLDFSYKNIVNLECTLLNNKRNQINLAASGPQALPRTIAIETITPIKPAVAH